MADHFCHARGCAVKVPPAMLMCRHHWLMLPARMRRAVYAEYEPGQELTKEPSDAYLAVALEAISWVADRERPPAGPEQLSFG